MLSCVLWLTRHSCVKRKTMFTNQDNNYKEAFNKFERIQVSRLVELSKGDYDAHFVLFKNDKTWIAVADDADRLFEVFGWQTSIVYDAKGNAVSWMIVTFFGMEVIKHSKYSYQVLDQGEMQDAPDSSVEQQICYVQQYVDFRQLLINTFGQKNDELAIGKKIVTHNTEINKILSIENFKFAGDKVYACLSDGRKVLVADSKSWLLDEEVLPLWLALLKSF